MKRIWTAWSVCMMLLVAPLVARADVAREVAGVLRAKPLERVTVGVVVARLGDAPQGAHVLFRNDSDVPLIPASNLKLVTTAAALDKLGPDFKFRTLLALRTREDGQHDLVIWGDGDPTLGDVEMLRKVGWGTTTVFENWAKQLKARGITSVRNVLVDDSIFDTQFVHPNWPPEQVHRRYVAGVGGLNLNANAVDFMLTVNGMNQLVDYTTDPATNYITVRNSCVRGTQNAIWLTRHAESNNITLGGQTNASTGYPVSVTIHDPPMFAATVFAETLQKAGITVTGVVRRDPTNRAAYAQADEVARAAWTFIAAHETPLQTVLARTNKDSMNLYAEALLKRIGYATTQQPGSWENGRGAIIQYLTKLGIPQEQYRIDDGSGLSRENRLSPNAIIKVLTANFHAPHREQYITSLAIADIDGTFANRFTGTDLRGRVFGKSGYINGVSSFSGYLRAKDGQWYAFSIIMNGIPAGTNSTMKQLQERIVQSIDSNVENIAVGG